MLIRDVIIYLSIKYQGDWDKIYNAIKKKESCETQEIERVVSSLGCKAITILDDNYPSSLKNIYKPPFTLFYLGDISLLESNIISIVGSRAPSTYASKSTKKIISDLKEKNVVICSGLARGIDRIVHEESLNNNLKTIAILPTGILYCYPKENLSIYEEIIKKGLIISEYPSYSRVKKEKFGMRNRIIAGLGDKLLVMSAKEKSGTMISVKFALEFGKDIYCLPYHIDEGSICNKLIKEGAYLLSDGKDIF